MTSFNSNKLTEFEENQKRRASDHEEVMAAIKQINTRLDPIYETYMAWLTLGKWGKTILYIAGAVLGLIVAWRQIFRK